MRKNLDTVEEFWSQRAIAEAYENANESSLEKFTQAFAAFLGVPDGAVHPVDSGKSALEGLLNARKDMRSSVMVLALNCVRVQEAIKGAGCNILTYDFKPEPGQYDWDLILDDIPSEVGVLIVSHLYGVPVDLRRAREFCNERGMLLIEDCAQTLGGSVAGRQVGTWGDAAIFSFSYDKPISLGWGGVAIVNAPDKFGLEENTFKRLTPLDPSLEIELFRKFVKSMEVRRLRIRSGKKSLSSIFHRVYNKWNLTAFYDRDLAFGAIQAELGVFCLEGFSEVRATRNANSDIFASLSTVPTWPVMNGDIEPAWLKQKVFVSGPKQLSSISRILQKSGIRAGNFNWPKLIGVENPQACPNAYQVATCWMDVPIHQRMEAIEIEDMASVIKEYT